MNMNFGLTLIAIQHMYGYYWLGNRKVIWPGKNFSKYPKGFFEHHSCQASVEAAQHPFYQKSDDRSVRIEVAG